MLRFESLSNTFYFIYLFIFVFLPFLGPLSRHMEVPRLGVQSELWLLAHTTAIAAWVQAVSATYTTAHGNAGSLNH